MLGVKAFGAVPSITSQPQSRTHTCGVAATFNVTAAGDAPLTYQWRFNAVNLSGGTTASLTLNPVLPSQVGSYAVVVSNGSGSVTSVVAQFVLTSPALVYVDDNYAGLADGMLVNFPSGAGGATYTIGCDAFATIPAAIGNVASGGTINVAAGIYNSFITVNKPLNLRGPNAGIAGTGVRSTEAILYPAANNVTFGNILDVATNFVTVDGFELNGDSPFLGGGNSIAGADANTSCGIRNGPFVGNSTTDCAYDIKNLTVQNNVFRHFTYYGVYIGRKFGVTTTNSFLVVRQNKFVNLYECGKFYATHPDFSDNWASNCLYLCFNWSVTGPAEPGFSPRIVNNRHFMSTDPSVWGAHSDAISAGRSIWIYVRESQAPPILVSNNVINFGAAGAPSGKDPHGITVDGLLDGRTVVVANNTVNGFGQYADCLGVLNVDATSTVMVRSNVLTGASWNSSSAGLFLTGNAGQITCLSNTILSSYYGIFSAGKLTVRSCVIRSNSGGVEASGAAGRVLLESSDVTGNLGYGLGADGRSEERRVGKEC